MKKVISGIRNHQEISLLLAVCLTMFILLYRKMLFGGYIYAYSDIGRDTLATYLPRYLFDGDWIRNGGASSYTLQDGLGAYIRNPVYKYIFPFNFFFVMSNGENIGSILLLSLFIKSMIIAVFSYLYFNKILQDKRAAAIGGMIWTFSGYMIVWGQHYQFATLILEFTVGIYFLQLFLEGKRAGFFFVLAVALTVFDSYFNLYMSGIFFAVYTVVWCVFTHKSIREIMKKLVLLFLMAVWGIGIAMVQFMPAMRSFFSSTRMNDVTAKGQSLDLIYGKDYILTFVGRLLSPNTLRTGNDFTGAYNYYEAALLSTSLLCVFAVIFLLQTQFRKRVSALLISMLLLLLSPVFSQVLGMNAKKQRWSYLFCFIAVLCIAYFLKYLFSHEKNTDMSRMLRKTVIYSDIVYAVLLLILLAAHLRGLVCIDKLTFFVVGFVVILYSIFFLLYGKNIRRHCALFLVGILFAELILINDSSVNKRCVISKDAWEQEYFNDGTIAAVNELKQVDDSLYRVNKTYISVGENDALVQGYNGLASYSSLNSQELVSFYLAAGYELINGFPHWISIPCYDMYINSLLGTKYLLAKKDAPVESEDYIKVLETEDVIVYQNLYALPFGYLYYRELSRDSVSCLERVDRQKALTTGFYCTDNCSPDALVQEDLLQDEAEKLTHAEVLDNLSQLQENAMTNIKLEENVLSGQINNREEKSAMLAIPIIYNTNWKIYVDGKEQKLYNINGGLIGTIIEPGAHTVEMRYCDSLEKCGVTISAVCLLLFIISMFFVLAGPSIFKKVQSTG